MKVAKDLVEAKELYHEILKFSDEGVIEGFPDDITSTIFLLHSKIESRLNKERPFNAFVLHQKSDEENELLQFLNIIKKNLDQFTDKTRLHIAILTSYIDDRTREYLTENKLNIPVQVSHWTAVDIFIDRGQVKTFVLDAVNEISCIGIHENLKKIFPKNQHYTFHADSIPHPQNKLREKFRTIQSDDENCRTFTLEHLRQLSQIDSDRLYSELEQISTKDGKIIPKNLSYGLELNRIFRATQSLVTLTSLPKILSTFLKENNTILDFIEKNSELNENGVKQNKAILNKRHKHSHTSAYYFSKLTDDTPILILEHRKGFAFIKNSILFQVKDVLSKITSNEFTIFIQLLCKNMKELISAKNIDHRREINNFFIKLTNLLFCENLSSAKNEILIRLASLFKGVIFSVAH